MMVLVSKLNNRCAFCGVAFDYAVFCYTPFSKCVTHYDTFTDTPSKDVSGVFAR